MAELERVRYVSRTFISLCFFILLYEDVRMYVNVYPVLDFVHYCFIINKKGIQLKNCHLISGDRGRLNKKWLKK